MFISVVVIINKVYDDNLYIKETIEAIIKNDFEDYEILIIENGLNAISYNIVADYEGRYDNIRYYYSPHQGLHISRNLGYEEAKGDIIAYIENGIIVPEGWLHSINNLFMLNKKVAIATGDVTPIIDSEFKSQFESSKISLGNNDFYSPENKCIQMGNEKNINSNLYMQCNYVIRKCIIKKTGGFHPGEMPQKYIMYCGDNNSHISEFVRTHNLSVIYDKQLSVSRYIKENELSLEYIKEYNTILGASEGYTFLRKGKFIEFFLKFTIELLRYFNNFKKIDNISKARIKGRLKGDIILLKNYNKYKLGGWIKKNNYFKEQGYVEIEQTSKVSGKYVLPFKERISIDKKCLRYSDFKKGLVDKFNNSIGANNDIQYMKIIPRLVISVSNRCTLNCKLCNNLMPYFKKRMDGNVLDIINDVEKIIKCIDKIKSVEIIGGEPFIYDSIDILVDYLIKQNKIDEIEITTNGSVLPNELVLKSLKSKKLIVYVSQYKQTVNKRIAFMKVLAIREIRCQSLENHLWFDVGDICKRNKGGKKLRDEYLRCHDNIMCRTLWNGRLYVCGRGVGLCEKYDLSYGFIDIRNKSQINWKDILSFYTTDYSGICDYCNMGSRKVKWIKAAEQI